MENYRFVTIGIHRYRFLPFLGGADAWLGELQQCLQQKIAIAEKQTLLFSDLRSFRTGRVIHPNGNNLRKALGRHCQGIFFQGYATQHNGEDYLLPIDAQGDRLPETAIPLGSLLESLKHPHRFPVWLLLDLVPLGLGNPISNQGLLEAKAWGINVVARFNARGEEPGDLGQNFLEALRYYEQSLNLELLELYLREKIVNPGGNEALIILNGLNNDPLTPFLPSVNVLTRVFFSWRTMPRPAFFKNTQSLPNLSRSQGRNNLKLILALGLLIFGLGLITFTIYRLINHSQKSKPVLNTVSPPLSEAAKLAQAKRYLQWQQASVFVRAIAELRTIPPDSPSFDAAQTQISLWSQIILGIAQGRAQVGNWQDAIAAAQLVPSDQPQLYEQAQDLIQRSPSP
ncbi:MAG: hypothetical protein ACRC6M_02180 [Microcystaceae cyanobacterium]